MLNKNLLSIDLELEQPNCDPECQDSKIDKPKIIQLGYCVFKTQEDDDIQIIESGALYLNYTLGLSNFIKDLTKITDKDLLESNEDALSALKLLGDLIKKYKCDRRIIEWGNYDLDELIQEAKELDEKETNYLIPFFGRTKFNAAMIYCLYRQRNNLNTGSLKASCKWEGLHPLPLRRNGKNKTYHDAEVDAIQTARIFNLCLKKIVKI